MQWNILIIIMGLIILNTCTKQLFLTKCKGQQGQWYFESSTVVRYANYLIFYKEKRHYRYVIICIFILVMLELVNVKSWHQLKLFDCADFSPVFFFLIMNDKVQWHLSNEQRTVSEHYYPHTALDRTPTALSLSLSHVTSPLLTKLVWNSAVYTAGISVHCPFLYRHTVEP